MIDDRYTIETPEHITFDFDIAGIGTRFLAAMIDSMLILIGQAIAFYVFGLLSEELQIAGDLFQALGVILAFSILWGYYLLFETIWNGQSPGKRLIGVRVVREGGRPITFINAVLRNLVRIVDFLPFFYGVGVIAMFVDPRARRLGDLVAGTLVVRERQRVTLQSLLSTTSTLPPAVGPAQAVSLPNLDLLTIAEYDLAQDFLRQRKDLSQDVRKRLAAQLASGLQARIGIRQDLERAELFLETLAAEYQTLERQNADRV